MPEITCRFYGELNDFLPKDVRQRDFDSGFKGRESVKDKIEALGIPHTEVDFILANGKSVDFTYILQDGDRISVYPLFEFSRLAGVTHLGRLPSGSPRFIADVNIHDVVKTMRALGLDVVEDRCLSSGEIADMAGNENRIILTTSRRLLKLRRVINGIFIRPGNREEQIRRILNRLSLNDLCRPFSRCLCCNTLLEPVPKADIWQRIPPKPRKRCNDFARCPSCDRLYWKGTHYEKIKANVDRILRPLHLRS